MKSQRGQALPLGLAMILVSILGALVLYNTGGTATDKARLANAADAAAYSGLLWQARALNFQAYTNRAMVANQVSIAQAVSMASWLEYGTTTTRNLQATLGALPFLRPLVTGADQAMRAVDSVVRPVTRVMVGVVDKVVGALSVSQQAMFASSFAATPEIVRDVIEKSDEAGRFTGLSAYGLGALHENLSAWSDFTVRHGIDDLDAMDERALLINESRDEFSRRRDWKFFNGFWFYSTPIMRHRVFKSGSTNLIAVDGPKGRRWEWMGKDTVALQNRRLKWNGKEKKSEVPIGWGASYANKNGGASLLFSECKRLYFRKRSAGGLPCGRWGKNKKADRYASREAKGIAGYNGLRAFRTINAALLAGDGRAPRPTLDEEPVVRLKVEASMSANDVLSSADSLGGETFGVDVSAAGERLSSISIAELYYRRPDEYGRDGGRRRETDREAANGYNPYWDVRLAPIPDEERLLAAGLRIAGAALAPGGTGSGALAPSEAVSPAPVEALAPDGASPMTTRPVATLAEVYGGADLAANGARVERYAALTLADLDGFAPDGGDVATSIGDGLRNELENAPSAILGSLASAGMAGAKGAIAGAGSALGGIVAMDGDSVERAFREQSERMEAVAGVVSEELGTYVEDLVATRVAEFEPDVTRMRELSERIETAAEEERAAFEEELVRLGEVRDEALQSLHEEITDRLVAVTAEHEPDWELPRDIAETTVDDFLEAFRGQLDAEEIDVIDWRFDDENDPDSLDCDPVTDECRADPNEGDDHGNY